MKTGENDTADGAEGSKTQLGKWLSPRELAEMLGVTEDAVYGWVRAAVIPFHRIGRSIRFSPADLERLEKETAILPERVETQESELENRRK